MACLNMYSNNDQQQGHCTSIPRISFSSDFSDPKHLPNHEINYREPPVSSDFEFSVPCPGRAMINAADELIFKGKLMPVRENSTKMTTLKDELLVDDDDEFEDVLPRLTKGSGWWGERWALKRAHNLTKKGPKNDNIFALRP